EKRLEIRKCNERLNLGKKQREPTFQVLLDALALTPCYFAFLITVDVPEVYMHQFSDNIHKYENSYRFRMDKKKKFDLWKLEGGLNSKLLKFKCCPKQLNPPSAGSVPCYGGSVRGAGTTFCHFMINLKSIQNIDFLDLGRFGKIVSTYG
ncbi:hypothetical protein Tco_0845026, partial [Tanacetum coccineum]